jgi:uncharacterized membrane protein
VAVPISSYCFHRRSFYWTVRFVIIIIIIIIIMLSLVTGLLSVVLLLNQR